MDGWWLAPPEPTSLRMQDFKRLRVWQLAHELRLEVRRVVSAWNGQPDYGLRSQLVRAASSIATNIAEGCGKRSPQELIRFGEIALASAKEVEDHLLEARDSGLLDARQFSALNAKVLQVQRMLGALIKTVRSRSSQLH